MALQASGPISFSQIANEFGTPSGKNLGAYRVSQSVGTLPNLPLDVDIPQSGSISFSNFYNKRLNVIVDLYSVPSGSTRLNARSRYNSDNVVVIGGFRGKPSSSNGSKVYINVNTTIGSAKGNRNNVALRTGLWDTNTELITIIGSGGALYGAGGDGGAGGGISGGASAGQGGQGSSAFGVDYSTNLINQGTIFSGRGGGGGGAGGYGWTFSDSQDGCEGIQNERLRIGGGGGAGGRGLPAGNGGPANTGSALNRGAGANFAGNGTDGSVSQNGSSGGGGSTSGGNGCNRHAFSGGGGGVESGGAGGNVSYNNQGSGGQRGYAIIIGSGASLTTVPGHNAPDGDIINDTVL
jgi:hypothetical protein